MRKQIKSESAKHQKYVEWSDQDKCFIGRCPTLFSGGIHGANEAKVYAEICETTEEWIELLYKDKAFSRIIVKII